MARILPNRRRLSGRMNRQCSWRRLRPAGEVVVDDSTYPPIMTTYVVAIIKNVKTCKRTLSGPLRVRATGFIPFFLASTMRLRRAQRDPRQQLRVPDGPAQVVAEKTSRRDQMAFRTVRQVLPVRSHYRHHAINDRFAAAPAAVLDQCTGGRAWPGCLSRRNHFPPNPPSVGARHPDRRAFFPY